MLSGHVMVIHQSVFTANHFTPQGCYELVVSFIESNMGIIAGVTFGIAFSQVLNMAFGINRRQ